MISGSNLENILRSGIFAVTGELGPPKSGDYEHVAQKARILKGFVDAVNITDCQTAIVRMSSLTAGLIAMSEGLEIVMQMTCRDRNRIGMQADILGAYALGVRNLLCITGDHQRFGNHPQAKGVFDLDSIQLIAMIKKMRDEKKFQCGEDIKSHEPKIFIGCAANPFAEPFEYRPLRLAKKIEAGANFVQTQIIYNVEKFKRFMEMVRDLGLHEKAFILAGITPPKSLGMAKYMKYHVPGLDVPDEIIQRLSDAKDVKEEGINIAVDIINQVREIPGVHGVHIMAIEWENAVPEIVKRAKLDNRPKPVESQATLISKKVANEILEVTLKQEIEKTKEEYTKEIKNIKENTEKELQKINNEKQSLASEKKILQDEISKLKDEIKNLQAKLSTKENEIISLNQKIQNLTTELEQKKEIVYIDKEEREEFIWGGEMTQKEKLILESITSGLESLRKALGLNEDQFDAIKKFLQAQFLLYSSIKPTRIEPSVEEKITPITTKELKELPKLEVSPEEEQKRKQVTNLIAKANVHIHKNEIEEAIKCFEEALKIDPDDLRAKEGLQKLKSLLPKKLTEEPKIQKEEIRELETADLLPPCPPELTQEEWKKKWIIRYVAIGNVKLSKGDKEGAIEAFNKALTLDPQNEKALKFLNIAKSTDITKIETKEEKITEKPVEPKVTEPPIEIKKEVIEKPPVTEKIEPPKVETITKKEPDTPISLTVDLKKEDKSLIDRLGKIDPSLFLEKYTGTVAPVKLGEGDKAIILGGSNTMPFNLFEGEMPHKPVIAYEIQDSPPDDWPETLLQYYSDVINDPIAWAKKCIEKFDAKAICLTLSSIDPNGLNKPVKDAGIIVKRLVEEVDIPIIIWGCGNAEKDTEAFREISAQVPNKRFLFGPVSDTNYRAIGATAMAMNLPVIASSPIDVNLAKQLNILLNNMGVPLNNILMDPSIGAVGYGLEYTYSVMERIRLAALSGGDDKLAVPFICNLGKEVWKTKECKLPTDDKMGDQESRGIMLEAITAVTLLLAGGELMIMRHPKAINLVNNFINALI